MGLHRMRYRAGRITASGNEAGTEPRLHEGPFHRELANANKVIEDAGAVVTEDDGFRWVDGSKLPADFMG